MTHSKTQCSKTQCEHAEATVAAALETGTLEAGAHDAAHLATLLRVIRGRQPSGEGDTSRPVVPREATSVLVMLNSHGNAHPRDAAKPDVGLDEHYMHFPYPVPAHEEGLYAT